jgi:hypothetical protein
VGHQRLGWIPKTRKWRAVVDGVVEGGGLAADDVDRIAALTLDAAMPVLRRSCDDAGLRYAFYLLTQITLAAREDEWRGRLSRVGIPLPEDASLFDLTAGLHSAIERYVSRHGSSSDIGEIAQQSASEALVDLAEGNATTLFGSGGEHLRGAVRRLSTGAGFGRLGQVFFGRFLSRFLNCYLSRVTASAVGGSRVRSADDVTTFNGALEWHCEQSARIVRDFCGQWYSKREYLEGINPTNAGGLVAVAVGKLSDELAQQRAES